MSTTVIPLTVPLQQTCTHPAVQPDYFFIEVLQRRRGSRIEGDTVCRDCKATLPFWWNGGRPIPSDVVEDE